MLFRHLGKKRISFSYPRLFAFTVVVISLCIAVLFGPPSPGKQDQALREQVKMLLHSREAGAIFDDSRRRPILLENLQSFYSAREFKPAWKPALLDSLAAVIRNAGLDGLVPSVYYADGIASGVGKHAANARTGAAFDVKASAAFLLFALHLNAGTIDPSALGGAWVVQPHYPDLAALLNSAMKDGSIGTSLAALRPNSAEYSQVKRLLADYRDLERTGGWPFVPDDHPLHHGDTGSAVAALKERLSRGSRLGPSANTGDTFDENVIQSVRNFQACHGLDTTGWADSATLAALNTPIGYRIGQIIANLDRCRWVQALRAGRRVLINIPEFHLFAYGSPKEHFDMRVIVGWEMARTPVFCDSVDSVVFQPIWTVPRSVAREEFLPRLQRDRSFRWIDSFVVYDGWDDTARRVDPRSIDWKSIDTLRIDRYRFTQNPGPANPLGSVKFVMTNNMQIYLHAAPKADAGLFSWKNRSMSHGCIRLERPFDLALYCLQGMSKWDSAAVAGAMNDTATCSVDLSNRIPVQIIYQTVFIDTTGRTNFRPDIYGYDSLQIRLMALQSSDTSGMPVAQ
jgi:murein L,D-transpeptidase YcbB/YkuD